MASFAPASRQEMRRGGAWNILEKAACFASAKKDDAAAAAWNENGRTGALSRGTDALGYGTAAGEELDRYAADGVGAMSPGTTSNFPSTAVLPARASR